MIGVMNEYVIYIYIYKKDYNKDNKTKRIRERE